jgi:hypothetical protein
LREVSMSESASTADTDRVFESFDGLRSKARASGAAHAPDVSTALRIVNLLAR